MLKWRFPKKPLLADKGADGRISLREAILATNNTPNGATADEIRFDIPEAMVNGRHTISPTSALPDIIDTVLISGTSEPDYSGTPVVELNGASAGAGVNGLSLANGSDGSTVRGLIITQFSRDGILIATGADNITVRQ